MACSMTGFGQSRVETPEVRVQVEMKTVNHRFCEWNLRIPRDLLDMEERIRQHLATRIARGRGDLNLTVEPLELPAAEVAVQWPTLDALMAATRQAVERHGGTVDVQKAVLAWMAVPEIVQIKRSEPDLNRVRAAVWQAIEEAAEQLVGARSTEGARLAADLGGKLMRLRREVDAMKRLAPGSKAVAEQRLQERMGELAHGLDETRWLTEVALLADRAAIDEELVRLDSHLEAFETALHQSGPVGRRLDFLVQEMHREVNTIGSKSTLLEVSQHVVEAKVVVEQLREQAQNVE